MLLLSIGAIGVAGLQLHSLRNSMAADSRGRIASLAAQMSEQAAMLPRMLINQDPSVVGSLANQACSSTATTELARWRRQLDCEVSGSQGAVTYDRRSNRLQITVQWDDSRGAGGGSTTQQLTLDTRI